MNDFHRRLEEEIPRLRRYARALTRDSVRADDLVQDTLIRALRKERSDSPAPIARLAFHHHAQPECKRCQARHARRRNGRRRKVCRGSHRRHRSDRVASVIRVERALGELSEEQRQVILLVGLEGMSYEDAAAVLTVPIGTIRSRLSRGRDALRKLLGMEIDAGSAGSVRNLAPEHLADTPAAMAA